MKWKIPTMNWNRNDATQRQEADATSPSLRRPLSKAEAGQDVLEMDVDETGSASLLDDAGGEAVLESAAEQSFKVYKRRWWVLLLASMLNASNTMSWISYAPVANFVDTYYGKQAANLLSMVFIFWAIPVGFFAMWMAGRFGLRPAFLLASWANCIGALLRLTSNVPDAGQAARFVMVMSGQCFAACAYPFIMFMPTKIAADWFPHNQRTIANVIASLSNPFGIMVANALSPRLVLHTSDVLLLNIILAVPAVVVCLLGTTTLRSSMPPTPPSKSAATQCLDFKSGLVRAFRSRSYVALWFALGIGMGVFNTLYTVMQQLLCSRGYDNNFAGLCCVLMIATGMVGATAVGYFVDRTKLFEETIKVSYALAVVSGTVFTLFSLQYHMQWGIVIGCVCFGFFGLAAYPLGFEMAAECTFPVAESTSAGLVTFSGQLHSVIFIALVQALGRPLSGPALQYQVCTALPDVNTEAYDLTVPMLVMVACSSIVACLFVLSFRPKYRRQRLDNKHHHDNNHPAKAKKSTNQEGILEIRTVFIDGQ